MKLSNLTILVAAAIAFGAVTKHAQQPISRVADQIGQSVKAATGPPQRRANIFVRLYRDMTEDRLFAVSAGVAFYALLALVPSLAVAVSLFGLFADPERLARLPYELTSILPHEAVMLVQGEAHRLASQSTGALSAKLGLALLLSLWSASSAIRAVFDALNVIDEQEETRSIFRLYATALAVTLGGVIVLSLAFVLIGANPGFLSFGGMPPQVARLYGLIRWPLFFGFAVFVIAFLYWVGPSHPPARFLRLLPGAAAAAFLWAFGSFVFSWYVQALAHYTATYGSLATVIVTMTWLWASAAIILLGAQFNYELSRHPSARSTAK